MNEQDITRRLLRREINGDRNLRFQREQHVSAECIKRLGLEAELQGHQGCVNCLSWNEDGSLLMSGSDDFQLIIWRALLHKSLTAIRTGHKGNIFSAKFMPHSGDNIVISGAADCEIRVHEVSRNETFHVLCHHRNRVKRIATSLDQPHVFWSAAEDGMVMQFDLRDRDCLRTEDPRCVLINLNSHVGANMEIKCLSINPAFSELLAIGANDPYARVYDRRMLQCSHISSFSGDRSPSSADSLPTGCIRYYVAGHLPKKQPDYKQQHRTLACTYITFNANGSDLLVNLGGEHIYLFDINNERREQKLESILQVNKSTCLSSSFDRNGLKQPAHDQTSNDFPHILSSGRNGVNKSSGQVEEGVVLESRNKVIDRVEEMRKRAKKLFDEMKYNQSINEYNLAISTCPSSILFSNRAMALFKRNWDGDVYAAMRDSISAIQLDDTNLKAHFRLAKCFKELSWLKEAKVCLENFQQKFPHSNIFNTLEVEIKNAMKNNKSTAEDSVSAIQTSVSTIYYRSREASLPENLLDTEKRCRDQAFDYDQRFCGHCNTTTDIKEANFFGSEGKYIVAGSDDGRFFVWEKKSSNIIKAFVGDNSIVNCLEPHPSCCLLATSGIESVVRLWSPRPDMDELSSRETEDLDEVAKANQLRMNKDPLEQMLVNMGYRITSSDAEGRGDNDSESPIACRTS